MKPRHHWIRVNIKAHGYRLVSSNRGVFSVLEAEDSVPRAFLDAENDVRQFLERGYLDPWAMVVRREDESSGPMIVYGVLLPVSDEKNRDGLFLIHGVQLDAT